MAKDIEFTYDIYIGAPVRKVWKGLIDAEFTKHYVYGTRLGSKLKKGRHMLTQAMAISRWSMEKSWMLSPRSVWS
jgi:hypothetical protein